MKYVTRVKDFLDCFYNQYIDINKIEFIHEDNLEYLLWDELIDYLEKNKDIQIDLYALLGEMYYKGRYVKEDYKKARDLFDKGIEKGSLFCMYKKSNLLIDSLELEYKEASELLIKASEKNFPIALNNLGWMYLKGLIGGKIDDKKAQEYFKKAAEANSAIGIANYGRSLMKSNKEKGMSLLKKAIEFGNDDALITLALYYYNGYYIEQNYEEAYKLLKKAMLNDNPLAFKYLAKMYEEGNYVTKDKEKAIFYYKMAINLGEATAKKELAHLINQELEE